MEKAERVEEKPSLSNYITRAKLRILLALVVVTTGCAPTNPVSEVSDVSSPPVAESTPFLPEEVATEQIVPVQEDVTYAGAITNVENRPVLNPHRIAETPEEAVEILDMLQDELIYRGVLAPEQKISIRVTSGNVSLGCISYVDAEGVSCAFNRSEQYNQVSLGLLAHELFHILGQTDDKFLGELQAAIGAYELCGRDSDIQDRYLFELYFRDNSGNRIKYSALDFVDGLVQQGVDSKDILKFALDNNEYQEIKHKVALWMEVTYDLSDDPAFINWRDEQAMNNPIRILTSSLFKINSVDRFLDSSIVVGPCIVGNPNLTTELDNWNCVIEEVVR